MHKAIRRFTAKIINNAEASTRLALLVHTAAGYALKLVNYRLRLPNFITYTAYKSSLSSFPDPG